MSVGVNAPVDYDGMSAVRPTARGLCPDFVPTRVTNRVAPLSGGHVGVYARMNEPDGEAEVMEARGDSSQSRVRVSGVG